MASYDIPISTPLFVYDADLDELNKSIREIEKEFRVKEIDITFREERLIFSSIRSSADAYNFVKEVIAGGLEVQEHFVVLYLNHANKLIGYYKHTKGTINSTQVDVELIVAAGLKILAKAVILSHNHPSGNTVPSDADKAITKKIKDGFKYFDVAVLDHIIATKTDYYSFADQGELSGFGTKESGEIEKQLRDEILFQLKKVTRANSPHIWQKIQTRDGYRILEEQIIAQVLAQQIVPAAIIPQMECEMDEV
jgi:DNA repair protein RadC